MFLGTSQKVLEEWARGEREGGSFNFELPTRGGSSYFFLIGIGTHLKHYDNQCFFFHNNKSLDNTKTFGNEFKFCIH